MGMSSEKSNESTDLSSDEASKSLSPTKGSNEGMQQVTLINDDDAKYPIDLPSPLLLATSMILAIVATGSLFELLNTGGNPAWGFAPTATLVVLGYPLCLYLFFAAIQKAKVETEEDDKAFLSGKNNNPYK